MQALFRRFAIQPAFGIILVGALGSSCFSQAQDTAVLLDTATDERAQGRYAAIDDLGEQEKAAAKAVPALTKLLSDRDSQVRWRSARSLADFGLAAQSAAPQLQKLLKDADPIVQYHAAVALGSVGDKSEATTKALIEAAAGKDERVARAALAAIRELKPGPQKVTAALAEALKSDDEAVQLFALETIAEHGAEATPLLNEALKNPETAYLATAAIEQIGPPAKGTVTELAKLIADAKHSHLLIQAMLAAASIGAEAKSAEGAIAPHLGNTTDPTVPVAAAYALGSIGAANADAALRAAMGKDNAFLQMVAAWALAKVHPSDESLNKQAVDKLVAGLSSGEAHIRNAAAKGLQSLQAPPEMVAPLLMKVANDPDPDVSANAVDAVASLGESVVPRATEALKKPEMRDFAVRVLTRLGPKARGAVNALVESMDDKDPHFRTEVQFALAAIGPGAAPATDKLAANIASDDAAVRESALFALRSIGPAAVSAREALVKLMEADDSFASLASAWALAKIAPTDSAVANKAVPKLVNSLSSPNEGTRLQSVEALGAWKANAKAAAALQQTARQDSDANIRAAAEAALKGAA
jgi:HEAT repeat protein